ncbi:2-oxo-4-hydroxy-4-carboxy-5-ureidoimidazoline decarboxylase [Plantactinospora endophytica]|uniref:2-oxo-4-hydroxy-4-carboxy-5-ureidoimidazoline decarboxylase n=1 Tax=Plantactinospora endophytica TaxID=673535 RepID=A0ABQ4ED35_9ACTN|nr:2-oxo-4-hydroxy-4-carboxy-5-ureidoimidazoline decarboxylase [Plantactinospora endophytica]GIG92640.1 OHCU decarboxylase [Plantactinospora endophytica]
MATVSAVLDEFNRRPAAEVEAELLACCAVPEWARLVADGRPYPEVGAVLAVADAALRRLGWSDLARALAAHPRIGERPTGTDRESAWSRREQAGMDDADPAIRAGLARANREYEQRFGHVFLVFANGRTDRELLAAARERLGNDPGTEREVVREELRQIALLRLRRLLS